MKTLKYTGFSLLVIVLLLVVVSIFLPSKVHVERTVIIKAPASLVFEQINTLRNWEKWSPWHSIDPAMKLTYTGPAMGPGARYSWSSQHPNVGNGILTLKKSQPNLLIVAEMDFRENGKGTGTYTFKELADGTFLTWAMDTDMGNNPVSKYVGLFMDGMIGPDFERGLANLKKISENQLSSNH
ncbi:SRPBCC family protein [Pontibacter vulgaris]|uniref:SRPBCC family protein n=1 Tax=Pontibacter vulgaris TaxID=2905679 RepID=UPI001FA7C664|nr:SRPBCC family protein [Pontibacter vulgaris]